LKFGSTGSIEHGLEAVQVGPDVALTAADKGNIDGPLHVEVMSGFVHVVVQLIVLPGLKVCTVAAFAAVPYRLITILLPAQEVETGIFAVVGPVHRVAPKGAVVF
jgi:hypothetical protein